MEWFKKDKSAKIAHIPTGGVFIHNDKIYMKIKPCLSEGLIYNSVQLKNGDLYHFGEGVNVTACPKACVHDNL